MIKTVVSALALTLAAGAVSAAEYEITVTNMLDSELLAPIVVTDAGNDGKLFTMDYVTAAAEDQILTGDPKMVVEAIGADMTGVGHGEDGPPGVLLAPGKSVTFDFTTDATALRILAMVAPTEVPDNYVSAVADVHFSDVVEVKLNRFDIGNDEGTRMVSRVDDAVATVKIMRK